MYFVRSNTLLLCISLLCIYLLYRTNPQTHRLDRFLKFPALSGHVGISRFPSKNADRKLPIFLVNTLLLSWYHKHSFTPYPSLLGWEISLEFRGIPPLIRFWTFWTSEFSSEYYFSDCIMYSRQFWTRFSGSESSPVIDCSNFMNRKMFPLWCGARLHGSKTLNSLTPKSVPVGTKLVLFGRYVLNIYVGIVWYILRKTKTRHAKIYLPTQCTNWQKSYDIN